MAGPPGLGPKPKKKTFNGQDHGVANLLRGTSTKTHMADHNGPKPDHGVGGGVTSSKPRARGGRSSVFYTPFIGEHK